MRFLHDVKLLPHGFRTPKPFFFNFNTMIGRQTAQAFFIFFKLLGFSLHEQVSLLDLPTNSQNLHKKKLIKIRRRIYILKFFTSPVSLTTRTSMLVVLDPFSVRWRTRTRKPRSADSTWNVMHCYIEKTKGFRQCPPN